MEKILIGISYLLKNDKKEDQVYYEYFKKNKMNPTKVIANPQLEEKNQWSNPCPPKNPYIAVFLTLQ